MSDTLQEIVIGAWLLGLPLAVGLTLYLNYKYEPGDKDDE